MHIFGKLQVSNMGQSDLDGLAPSTAVTGNLKVLSSGPHQLVGNVIIQLITNLAIWLIAIALGIVWEQPSMMGMMQYPMNLEALSDPLVAM